MERMQVNAYSVAIGGIPGLVVGGILGYLAAKRILGARFEARLGDELAAANRHYKARGLLASNSDIPVERPSAVGHDAGEDQGSAGLPDSSESENDDLAGVKELPWPPASRDTTKPYVISPEEFAEQELGWQAVTITYYAADRVLTDDKEQPIRDIRSTVGPLSKASFGGISGDPNIRYIRNERLELDFEIVLDERAYVDVVLNYGNPNRRKDESKGG